MTEEEAIHYRIGSENNIEVLEEILAQILDKIKEALWDNEENIIIIHINN